MRIRHLSTRVLPMIAVASAMLIATRPAPAQPIQQALSVAATDAEVVVLIPSLSQLNERIAEFSAKTGLNAFLPELNDSLSAVRREATFLQNTNDDGAMLVVISGLAAAIEAELDDDPGNNTEPKIALLVPVDNFDAYVQNLGGDAGADTTQVTMSGTSKGYAGKIKGYAVLSEEQASVAAYTTAPLGKTIDANMGQLLKGYLNKSDALVYCDMKTLRPQFKKAIARMEKEAAGEMGQLDAQMMGMAQQMIDLYAEFGNLVVDGSDAAVFTADLGANGVGFNTLVNLAAGSELNAFFNPPANPLAGNPADGQSRTAKLLGSAPDRPFIYAVSVDSQAVDMGKLLDRVNTAMEGADAAMVEMYRPTLEMLRQSLGTAGVFYTPDMAGMMSGGMLNTVTFYDTKDPAGFLASQKAGIEKMGEMKIPMGEAAEGEEAPAMSFNTTYTPNALQVEGVSIDQYQVNFVLPQEMTQAFNPMIMMVANAGYGGYIGAKDGTVVMTTTPDLQLMTRALQSVGKNEGLGSAGAIAQLRGQDLPQGAFMEAYLSFGGIGQMANQFLPMIAPGAQLNVPADLPPLAMGVAAEDNGVVGRYFIPAKTVTFMVDTYNMFAAQMQQQNGGGGGRPPRAN